ncbi:bifunctional glutathione transferase/peroxidase [Lecanora helva]
MPPVTRGQEQATMKPQSNAKITLYWLEQSRAQRILWLLEELKIDYDLKTYKRQNMLAPKELQEIHPLGKSPLVKVESEATPKPVVLAESGLIIEYLIDHFGPYLVPERYQKGKEGQVGGETEEWLRYRYLMHYGEGSLMPLLVFALIFNTIKRQSPFFIKPIVLMITGGVESKFLFPELDKHFNFLETQIATSPNRGEYLCGSQLTGADIMMSFPLSAAKGRSSFSEEKHPKLWAYVDRIQGLEGYKKAVQKIVDTEGSYDPRL